MTYLETKKQHLSILTSCEKKEYSAAIKMLEKSYDTGKMDYVINSYNELNDDLSELFDVLALILFPSWN